MGPRDVRQQNMNRTIPIVLLWAIATICTPYPSIASPLVVTEKGLYQGTHERVEKDSTSPTQTILLEGKVQLLSATNVIPIKLGSKFGLHYTIPSMMPTQQAGLLWEWSFPPMTNTHGDVVQQSRSFGKTALGETNFYMLYDITEPYEMVYGTWTFRILWKDDVWASETFQTIPAP